MLFTKARANACVLTCVVAAMQLSVALATPHAAACANACAAPCAAVQLVPQASRRPALLMLPSIALPDMSNTALPVSELAYSAAMAVPQLRASAKIVAIGSFPAHSSPIEPATASPQAVAATLSTFACDLATEMPLFKPYPVTAARAHVCTREICGAVSVAA